jgi:CHASE3 domain sensor protein
VNIRDQEKRPLYYVAGAMTLMALVLFIGGLSVRELIIESFQDINFINATLQTSSNLLKTMLDEETGVRGAAATGSVIFLEPYNSAARQFPIFRSTLSDQLVHLNDVNVSQALVDLTAIHDEWENTVADRVLHDVLPPIRNRPHLLAMELRGKSMVDHIRLDFKTIDDALNVRRDRDIQKTKHSIDAIGSFILSSVLIFLAICALILRHQYRLSVRLESTRLRTREIQAELTTKQHIAEVLQEALSQRPLPAMPAVRFSATYVPATEQSKVGGDWYDAIELSRNRVLFIIGDVAGHGIEAAVGMSRARQAFIGSALRNPDPARVLHSVNAELHAQGSPMVTAVCGLADSETYEFIFAVAGHPPPLLIEPGHKPRLLPCGGLPLGVLANAHYQTRTVQTVPSSMMVLYTDGAVEHSHDVLEGEALLISAAEQCRSTDLEPATAIHRAIFEGRSAGDDVAILTLGFTSEQQTGMKISAEHLQTSFSGKIRNLPRRNDSDNLPQNICSPISYRLGAA